MTTTWLFVAVVFGDFHVFFWPFTQSSPICHQSEYPFLSFNVPVLALSFVWEMRSMFDKHPFPLLTVLIKSSITIFICSSSPGAIWYRDTEFHGLWNIHPISFLASLWIETTKNFWHVGDEFSDSELSNDYLSQFKLCSRIETLYYTVKSLKLMVRRSVTELVSPETDTLLSLEAVQISLLLPWGWW